MRWSKLFVPTLRDAPGDAEAASHQLLVRGGFIRQLHAGHYSMLPLGHRVHQKIADIIRDEMNAIGGQEFLLPAMHPASIWHQSGRWDVMGDEMFRLTDRRGNVNALGMTHEEVFALLASELNTYKALPQIWYQIQWKFRDEPRPKAGLLRVREFAMKDAYSLDIDDAGLDAAFELHRDAYVRIFNRCGLPAVGVEASSGAMGGSGSVEFMVPSPAGEDDVVRCTECDYAANIERATSALVAVEDPASVPAVERFATPGVRTIAALEVFDGGAAADRQIKSLVMVLDGTVVLVLVRGDHQLNHQKLVDATGAIDVRPAGAEETVEHLGAHPGSLGPVGVTGLRIIADEALRGRRGFTTGANDDDWHIRNVDVDRDVAVDEWADLREVTAGERCPECAGPLEIVRCIEVGHIFKLGRRYAEAMGATVLDPDGRAVPVTMGSYGIGVGRAMATVAETHHDDRGLIWPVAVAPFEVVITVATMRDEAAVAAGQELYATLRERRVDVLFDDRDARAGVKFADAELIGIPVRVTLGKALVDGLAEVTERATGDTERVPLADVVDRLVSALGR